MKFRIIRIKLKEVCHGRENISDNMWIVKSTILSWFIYSKSYCFKPSKKSFRFKTDSPRVFVTDDIAYASAFTWNWTDSDGVKLGRINNDPYTIEIPKKFKSIVSKGNCSIYIVKGDFKQIKNQPTEYFTKSDVPVLKELKYSSPLEAMRKNGLVVKWI